MSPRSRPPSNQEVQQVITPSIDRAYMNEEFSRKVRRRRGHTANDTGAAPGGSVAARVLLAA